MADVRTIEELIADVGIIASHLAHARSLLSTAKRKRDRMRRDGDTETAVNTQMGLLLGQVKDITDQAATDLAALNFTHALVVKINVEQGWTPFHYQNKAIAPLMAHISSPAGSGAFTSFVVGDKVEIRKSCVAGMDGYYVIAAHTGDAIVFTTDLPDTIPGELGVDDDGPVEIILRART